MKTALAFIAGVGATLLVMYLMYMAKKSAAPPMSASVEVTPVFTVAPEQALAPLRPETSTAPMAP